MYACDFEYDGQYLSDFGFVICNFDGSSGFDTVSAGSKISFNTVSTHRGKKYILAGTEYEECITTTFDICKNPGEYSDLSISNDEYRELMRWLNRNEFLKFRIFSDEDGQEFCYYNASFNVEKLLVDDKLYGLELSMETDKPFGYAQEFITVLNIVDTNKTYMLIDYSDEIGYTYPPLEITCNEAGDLSIYNAMEECTMVINNVSVGEIITIDGQTHIIESSLNSHKIYNDFNFEFFRIGNKIDDRINRITSSLKCNLKIKYTPVIKDAPN